jgi:GST-like protein
MLKFYFRDTPSPRKIALFLEKPQLPYELVLVDLLKGEQHKPAFTTISPNGKSPPLSGSSYSIRPPSSSIFQTRPGALAARTETARQFSSG